MSERVPAGQEPAVGGNEGGALPEVRVTWLRFDDVECVRGRHWAGPEGERCYVVTGEGVVCEEHITFAEVTRALR